MINDWRKIYLLLIGIYCTILNKKQVSIFLWFIYFLFPFVSLFNDYSKYFKFQPKDDTPFSWREREKVSIQIVLFTHSFMFNREYLVS